MLDIPQDVIRMPQPWSLIHFTSNGRPALRRNSEVRAFLVNGSLRQNQLSPYIQLTSDSMEFVHGKKLSAESAAATHECVTAGNDNRKDGTPKGSSPTSIDHQERPPLNKTEEQHDQAFNTRDCAGKAEIDPKPVTRHDSAVPGLLSYQKWWENRNVEISVNGKLFQGIPVFLRDNTLRVVNEKYSYIIPMHKIDYIRTPDGLQSLDTAFDGCWED